MTTMDNSVEVVQNRINGWLDSTPLAERKQVINDLQRAFPWQDMHDGGRAVPFLTLPHLITNAVQAEVRSAAEMFLRVLMKLELTAFADRGGSLWKRLYSAASPESQYYLDQPYFESPQSAWRRFRRADGIVDGLTGIIRFLEMNQVGPQALTRYDSVHRLSANLLEVMGVMVQRPTSVCDGILDWLIVEYQQHNNTTELPQCIGVPVEPTYSSIMSAIPAAAERMQATANVRYGLGAIKIVVCHQANFELEGGTMYIRNFDGRQKCDVVWRNAARFKKPAPLSTPDIQSWQQMVQHPDALVVTNETGPRLTRTKGAFDALWDEKVAAEIGLTPDERAFVARHIPETHYLRWASQDRLAEILATKDIWVLKPSDGGLGEGIKFGAKMTRNELHNFMLSDASVNYVAQRYVAAAPIHLPHLLPNSGEVVRLTMDADLSPMIVGGNVGGHFLARGNFVDTGNEGPRTHNIALGGAVIPVFAV